MKRIIVTCGTLVLVTIVCAISAGCLLGARSSQEVWFVPNAGHVDLHRAAGEQYESRGLAFLGKM